ncbi:DUF7550 family protein [Halomicrobium salinisoli]|uniref:DUF7550 family protein n=1 Tax=Halomicrobium salinisoli TaxID=2878391 RepID=UPI001CF07C66|nr:hypothetical protein [Halomicrobium salinisoli]
MDENDEGHEGEHEADRPDYDPQNPEVPDRAPPLRETAPQSDFTMGQVATGFVVLAVGLAVVFGLSVALV